MAHDVVPLADAHVHEHVGVGQLGQLEVAARVEGPVHATTPRRRVVVVAAVLLLHCGARLLFGHALVVKAVPLLAIRADERVVMAAWWTARGVGKPPDTW